MIVFDGDLQKALFFPAVDGEDAVVRNAPGALFIIVILRIDAVFLFCGLRHDEGLVQKRLLQPLADFRIVGDLFCQNIVGALNAVLFGRKLLLRVQIGACQLLQRFSVQLVLPVDLFQGLQSPLPRNGGAGPALLFVRAVQVLQLCQRLGLVQRFFQLVGHLPLLVHRGDDLLPALFEVP